MKRINTIPKPLEPVISLGIQALAGAQSIGAEIDLQQNTATKIAAELHDLIGDSAAPLVPGKQSRFAEQKVVVKNAYSSRNVAIRAGREYCRLVIGVLKAGFGARWNSQWNAAGFVSPTLALPADPLPMLVQLREFLNANPAMEVPAIQMTAERAQALIAEIQGGHSLVAAARGELLRRKAARDQALKKLRRRLSGLRTELVQLLAPDDGRWNSFGFRRPADGRIPAEVTGLSLTPAGSGAVLVKWEEVSRADNYRVTWNAGSSGDESRIVTDSQCVFTGLPEGMVTFRVAARNAAGETAPAEVSIFDAHQSLAFVTGSES